MESQIIKYPVIAFIFLCLLLVSCPGCSQAGCHIFDGNFIRIAVLKDAQEIVVSIRGSYKIINSSTGKVLSCARSLKKSRVSILHDGIKIGEKYYPCKNIRLMPKKDVSIFIGNRQRRYRGTVDILSGNDKNLLVINTVELEQYIKGVLYHEVSHRWPMEALKAQAVVARTYAFYQIKNNKDKKYDVTSGIYSQVYGGRSAERFRTNIAVNRTRSLIMLYNGDVLPAYYHSNCGGHTEDAGELWKHDLPPLKGVRCKYCKGLAHYKWKKNFHSKAIQAQLNKNGYNLGAIKDIRVIERNKSGRVRNLRITARDGSTVVISGKKFRNIIGPNKIKSNLYDVVMKGYYFDLIGKGWGHGVGMCQWGAYSMAKQRYKYEKILKYYYPGIKIICVEKLK